jgi:hypothetical protein
MNAAASIGSIIILIPVIIAEVWYIIYLIREGRKYDK